MRWTGIIVALFIVFHLDGSHVGHREPRVRPRRSVQQPRVQHAARPGRRSSTSSPTSRSAFHLYHGAWSLFQSLGHQQPEVQQGAAPVRAGFAGIILVGNLSVPDRGAARTRRYSRARTRIRPPRARRTPAHDARLASPRRPARPRSGTTTSSTIKLVNPANKRRFDIIVVGTGLAGASAAASLGELGYNVKVITFHDSPRRAHSIAAQGGINAAKNYKNDGDSIYRLFYDTIKGGDYRAREGERVPARAGVGRHHRPVRRAGRAVRARVRRPARQPLVRWRAGVAHVLRARSDRPAAAARRVPGADAPGARGHASTLYPRTEMLDLVVKDGRARRHRVPRPEHAARCSRCRATRSCSPPAATATSSTSRRTRRTRTSRRRGAASKRGAYMANPCFTQIHPTCIPASDDFQSKLTLMSESLRNDGRVWVPTKMDDTRSPGPDPRGRPRLLPRAALPGVRQPRAARRRVARDQARGRRRARRRAAEERRVPRLRGVDRAARPRRHRGALQQPLRDVRPHHRRGPVHGPDAHLPRDPLHDGRAVGRLQPA